MLNAFVFSRTRIALLVAALFSFAAVSSAENLFPNGDFDTPNVAGDWPDKVGRPNKGESSYGEVNGDKYISLTQTTPLDTVMIYQQIGLQGAERVKITVKCRVTDLVKGPKSWFDARIMGDFRDMNSNKIKDFKPFVFNKDTNGWVERSIEVDVPEGAIFMAIMPSLLQVNAGTLDISSITVEPVALEAVAP